MEIAASRIINPASGSPPEPSPQPVRTPAAISAHTALTILKRTGNLLWVGTLPIG